MRVNANLRHRFCLNRNRKKKKTVVSTTIIKAFKTSTLPLTRIQRSIVNLFTPSEASSDGSFILAKRLGCVHLYRLLPRLSPSEHVYNIVGQQLLDYVHNSLSVASAGAG